MAIIAQIPLFSWKEMESLGDLKRLQLVLDAMPDEALMLKLERRRGRGRDDYPVRAMWNSLLAGIVFQHPSVASLRRELLRNDRLCSMCGFDLLKEERRIPSEDATSRFLKLLMRHPEEIQSMFDSLVKTLHRLLPEFGKHLVVDSKAISSHGKNRRAHEKGVDGRRDREANVGVKTYRGNHEDGTPWGTFKHWFGYELHLVADGEYELPVAFEVTPASASEHPVAKTLLSGLKKSHAELLEGCDYFLGDRGYDSGALVKRLWDEHRIKPVIDIRNAWQQADGEETRVLPGTTEVTYDYRGNVFCTCLSSGEVRAMAYGGFEKQRESLKYRCPAKQYGLECRGQKQCPLAGSIRIKLAEDRRVFTPLARSSYAWKDIYRKRSSVERVFSRVGGSFGFDHHFIRGQKKMKLQCGLALCVMLAMAVGRVKENQVERIRSLVAAA
jgi:hypothetical protein